MWSPTDARRHRHAQEITSTRMLASPKQKQPRPDNYPATLTSRATLRARASSHLMTVRNLLQRLPNRTFATARHTPPQRAWSSPFCRSGQRAHDSLHAPEQLTLTHERGNPLDVLVQRAVPRQRFDHFSNRTLSRENPSPRA